MPVFFEWTNKLPADFETGEYGVCSDPGIPLGIMDLHSQKNRLIRGGLRIRLMSASI
jgi:hypothetical protein